jgi:hypothetical protein
VLSSWEFEMAKPYPLDPSGGANYLADAVRKQAEKQQNLADAGVGIGHGSRVSELNSRISTLQKMLRQGIHPNPMAGQQQLNKLTQELSSLQSDSQQATTFQKPNPLEQILQNLQSGMGAYQPTPMEELRRQAELSAGRQFDPVIDSLKNEMSGTKKRAARNQDTARSMYGDNAKDILAQIPNITNEMSQASQATEARYNEAQEALQGQYNQQAQQQAELFKQLGIQAAAPEAGRQAMEDQAYFQNQSNLDKQSAMDVLSSYGATDRQYTRDTAANTRLAGENTAQDIGFQLEDYLQAAQGQMGSLQQQRATGIEQALMQLMGMDSQRVQSGQQMEFQRQMAMAQLQMQMQKMEQDREFKMMDLFTRGSGGGGSSDQLFKGTSGLSGASNYLAEQYGPNNTFTTNQIMNSINDVISHPDVIAGKYVNPDLPGNYGEGATTPVTQEYMIDLLRQRMMQGDPNKAFNTSFNSGDINHAINALLAYSGGLR